MPVNTAGELVLDQCLDRMFEGNEWFSLITIEGQASEVLDLMEVAELLRQVAARNGPMPELGRRNVLARLRGWIQQTVYRGSGEAMGMKARALGR